MANYIHNGLHVNREIVRQGHLDILLLMLTNGKEDMVSYVGYVKIACVGHGCCSERRSRRFKRIGPLLQGCCSA